MKAESVWTIKSWILHCNTDLIFNLYYSLRGQKSLGWETVIVFEENRLIPSCLGYGMQIIHHRAPGGFVRLWVHQSRQLLSVGQSTLWQKKLQLASILISLLNIFGFHLVKSGAAPSPSLLLYPDEFYLMRKLPGQWELCSSGDGGVYSLHSHTERRKITLCGAFVLVIWVPGSYLGLWCLHWRVNPNFIWGGSIIWRLQRPFRFPSWVLDPGPSALWKNLSHPPKLDCSPVWHRRCHCLVITVYCWPSLMMDL